MRQGECVEQREEVAWGNGSDSSSRHCSWQFATLPLCVLCSWPAVRAGVLPALQLFAAVKPQSSATPTLPHYHPLPLEFAHLYEHMQNSCSSSNSSCFALGSCCIANATATATRRRRLCLTLSATCQKNQEERGRERERRDMAQQQQQRQRFALA